jgi:predicted  nucleic acid-binding Zn-ribbon protein
MNKSIVKLLIMLAAALSALPGLAADDGKDKAARAAREQARRTQQQLKALEAEKGQLAADKAKLEGDLKEAKQAAEVATQRAGGAERARAALAKTIEILKADAATVAAKLAEEERRRTDAERRIAEIERKLADQGSAYAAEKNRLEAISASQLAALAASRARNERMYKLGFELIERYEQKPFWTSALQAEPFTGLKRAQIEKMAEEERDKFDRERLPASN